MKVEKGFGSALELIVDARGLPITIHLEGADVHEARLVEPVIEKCFVKKQPERLGGDKAYDSDPLYAKLSKLEIEMIAAHRRNRKRPAT